jgi:hypothetical protein
MVGREALSESGNDDSFPGLALATVSLEAGRVGVMRGTLPAVSFGDSMAARES